jgi:hypothetical protein
LHSNLNPKQKGYVTIAAFSLRTSSGRMVGFAVKIVTPLLCEYESDLVFIPNTNLEMVIKLVTNVNAVFRN